MNADINPQVFLTMSFNTSRFATIARDGRVTDEAPRVIYQGQTTFTKLCLSCGFHTPHVLVDGGSKCIICEPIEEENAIRPTETDSVGRDR